MIVMVAIGIFSAIVQLFVYVAHNRRVVRGKYPDGDERKNVLFTP
jgi:hypothetical protein